MRIRVTIFILILNSLVLLADWEATDKGHISTDSLIGNKRYILEENAVVVENKYSIKKFDLNTGNIINEIMFDDTTHSMAVADDNLDKVYLLYDSLITIKGKYVYHIINFKNNDTIKSGEKEAPYYGPKVERNLSLLNDSLLFFTGNMIEDYHIFQSTTPFSIIIELDSYSSVRKIIDSDFYFYNYNLWNPRKNSLMVVSDEVNSTGKHGGSSEVKLKIIILDSLKIVEFNRHSTRSNDGYVPKASFSSYIVSNNSNLIYYDYYYYTYEFLPNGEIDYTRFNVNELIDYENDKTYEINHKLGDYVRFTTDDRWLVATTRRNSKSVDFKVFSLKGELIFYDILNNVTNAEFFCYTDSTFFFESGAKIFKYNPFDNNLTNVSENNTKNLIDIYPNPTNKFLNINLPEVNSSSVLTVFDQIGNIVETVSLDAGTIQNHFYKLDISLYPTGLYFIQISNRNKTKTNKFIKL